MDQLTTEIRARNWAAIVTECNSSTLSKQEWCRQNNVSIKSFYYWQHKLRTEGAQHPGFTEVTVEPQYYGSDPAQTAAVITAPGLRIEVMNAADEAFLRKLMRVLTDA